MSIKRIILSGEGGQGIQTIAKILSIAIVDAGYNCQYIPSFGVEQRGTPSVAFLSYSKQPLFYPKFDEADIAVALQERAISVISQYVTPRTKVIFDSSTIDHKTMPKRAIHLFGIPATKIASEKFNQKAFNMIITGYICKELGLNPKITWKAIEKVLGKKFKTEEIKKANQDAFEYGCETITEIDNFTKPIYKPKEDENIYKDSKKTAVIVPSRCKGCGICIERCPVKALSFGEDLGVFATPVPVIDMEKCIACGKCNLVCPDSAIKVTKN